MKTKTNKIDGSFRNAVLGLARHPENAKLKELVELGREASCLDPAFSDAGKKRLEYCLRRIIELRTELNR